MGIETATLMAIAGVVSAGASLYGAMNKPDTAAPPPVEPATPMPDEEALKKSRRRSITAQLGRRGRQSTILTDTGGDALGG